MKYFLLITLFSFSLISISQTTTTFNYTGSVQTWTVPACVTSITVTAAGGKGGGTNGGNGAVVTGTLAVTPGQVLEIRVGGAGSCPAAGWNGGGAGDPGVWTSCGGGGASDIRITPYAIGNRVMVAAGGGGCGGGTPTMAGGGAGGCTNGTSGTSSYGGPGTGGTQTSGGTGGNPYASPGTYGQAGSLGQGGNGGIDNCSSSASGGAGGGGYYGGGGGGPDCISLTSYIGGGGGGGGSSLIPLGGGCNAGSNNGPGYVTIVSGTGVTATNTGPYCEGATIQLNGSPGTTYSWTGPNGFVSNVQNPTITNSTIADSGTYSLTVTGTGCSAAATTTVVIFPPIIPSAGVDDTVCFGSPINLVGTLSVSTDTRVWSYLATGITPAPTVQILPASNSLTPTINVNQPGLYSFILLESNPLCGVARDTVNIYVKQMDITVVSTNTSCQGYSDGSILLDGTDAVEYSFDNAATWSNVPLRSDFPAGNHTVCVRDANLCQACTVVTISDPAPIVLSVSNDTLICQNGNAYLSASAVGGISYVYDWELFPTTANTQVASPTVDTWYVVQAFSESGCPSNVDSIFVTLRSPISGTISPDVTICPGYPTPLTADAAGGIGTPYTFDWNSGETGNGSSHTISANPSQTMTYSVTITDECETSPLVLSTLVTLAPLPVPLISTDLDNKCEPATFNLTNETDPTMVDLVYWELSDGQIFVNQNTVVTDEMWANLYNVQLVITSPAGCVDSATFNNFLQVHPKPVADFRHNPNPVLMYNPQVQLTNYSINGETYQWFIESGNPDYSELKHLQTSFPDGVTGQYEVTLITTSEFGCIDTSTQIVVVYPEIVFYAPNAFTPDDDELNQSWGIYIEGIDIYDFELLIFNRWGEIIWESHDPSARWDGTYGGKYIEQGTYTWVVRTKDVLNDGKYEFNGFVTILK